MSVRVTVEDGIMFTILEGVVTAEDLAEAGDRVAAIEDSSDQAPPRVADLRGVTSLEISYRDIMAHAGMRSRARLANPVRSALVVADPVVRAAAAIFQIMNRNPNITLRMFEDMEAARGWVLAEPGPAGDALDYVSLDDWGVEGG